jgi:predicted RNA binding protein YcfA (HicA-like mRNA interferase family)
MLLYQEKVRISSDQASLYCAQCLGSIIFALPWSADASSLPVGDHHRELPMKPTRVYTHCEKTWRQRLRADPLKVRDVITLIEDDGWYLVVTRGSHRQYKHPTKSGRVTIAGHPSDDLAPGTLNSVLKQAQLGKPRERQ